MESYLIGLNSLLIVIIGFFIKSKVSKYDKNVEKTNSIEVNYIERFKSVELKIDLIKEELKDTIREEVGGISKDIMPLRDNLVRVVAEHELQKINCHKGGC